MQKIGEKEKRGEAGEKDNIRLSNFQMISNETQSALASCQLSQPLCNRALKLDQGDQGMSLEQLLGFPLESSRVSQWLRDTVQCPLSAVPPCILKFHSQRHAPGKLITKLSARPTMIKTKIGVVYLVCAGDKTAVSISSCEV